MSQTTSQETLSLFRQSAIERAERKHRKGHGPKQGAAADNKRLNRPTVIPEEVAKYYVREVSPPFKKLAVDSEIQRKEIASWVNELSAALRAGSVPEAIHVVTRQYGHEDPDIFWIVDGQQRFWAHWDANKPITCYVHRVTNRQQEKDLFTVLNRRSAPSPNITIRNDGGVFAKTLVALNAETGTAGPLTNRIHFNSGAPGSRIAASSLLTGAGRLIGGYSNLAALGQISRVMDSSTEKRQLVIDYLLNVGQIWPTPTRPRCEYFEMLSVALRQAKYPRLDRTMIRKLARVPWDRIKATTRAERIHLGARRVLAIIGKLREAGEEEVA